MSDVAQGSTHRTVLLEEAVEALRIIPDGVYVDGTFGRGGHARAILAKLSGRGRLFAMDKDPQAITCAQNDFGRDARVAIAQASFAELGDFARQWGVAGQIDGVLLDLGVSSPQLDDATRGFSFRQDGPLDMRMDPTRGVSAAQWIGKASEDEIVKVLRDYGEERFARRIARAIVTERGIEPIITTRRLAAVVARAHPAWEKGKDPSTRSFQAIRILVNNELEDLSECLKQIHSLLAMHGRLAVISFHSLEDRIVKRFIQHEEKPDDLPPDLPIRGDQFAARFKRVGKAIDPGEAEIAANPRARSAHLRVAEKIG